MISSFRMVWALFDRRMRGGALAILLLTLVTGITDAGSVAVVIPVIQVAMDPVKAASSPVLGHLHALLGAPQPARFVMLVCLLLLLFFVVKNALSLALLYAQQAFITRNRARMSTDLVRYYLVSPYVFHLRTNTATLFRNAVSAVIDLFNGTVQSLFTIVAEGLVAVAILVILVLAEPRVALLSAALLGVAGLLFQKLLRRRIARWGQEAYRASEQVVVHFNHAFGSIKETKVLGCEPYFAEAFGSSTRAYARRQEVFAVLNQSPRMVIEVLGVLGLLAAVVAMTLQQRANEDMVAAMGMFAMAAFRLMPSLSRLANAVGNLHFNFALTEELSRDLAGFRALTQGQPTGPAERLHLEREIVVEGVGFRYPGAEHDALTDVSLTIRRGESVAIVGASGSGKTTLSNILLGLLTPTAGTVRVDGTDIGGSLRGWQDTIGLVPEAVFLTDDSLRRNIAFGRADAEIDEARIVNAVRLAQLEQFVAALPDGLDTLVGERGTRLSGGQRQRVAIARSLYHDAEVLMMDEATSALDAETEATITAGIESLRGDRTIVVIAHRLSTVRHCDRVFLMEGGRLVDSGGFDELAGKNPIFANLVRRLDLSPSAPMLDQALACKDGAR